MGAFAPQLPTHRCTYAPTCSAPSSRAPRLAGRPAARRSRAAPSRVALVVAATAVGDDVQVAREQLSATRRKLTVTVPASMVQDCFSKTVENLKSIVGNLPGFRKDKIPLSMLVTQCGGQRQFKLTIIEEILVQTLPLVMSKVGEPIIPESERVASNVNELEAAFDPAKPLTLEIEYETVPPISWKQSYKDVTVTIRDTGNFQTDTEAAEGLIREYRKEKGHQKVVVGRGLQRGDTCIVDLAVRSPETKMPLPGLTKKRCPIDTERDPLGVTQGMLGMSPGEERTLSFTFPDDYSVELWQGMRAEAVVKLHEVFNWVLPEFNDAFVKAYFPKFESAEEMRKGLIATTAMERVKDLDKQLEDAVMEGVVSCMEVGELPEKLMLDMGTTQYRAALMSMIENRIASQEDIEKLATEEMVDEYMAKRNKDLQDMVKFNLAVDVIFEEQGLALEEAEMQEEVAARKQQYDAQKLECDVDALREQVRDTFKHVKVIEWLKDNLKRNVVPYSPPATA